MRRLLILFMLLAASCAVQTPPNSGLMLLSSSFADGELIPDRFTYSLGDQCSGGNISPNLSWTGTPSDTRSLALTVVDPDGQDWVHWVLFDIPAELSNLPETPAGLSTGTQGTNSFGQLGWGGPCPPSGSHRYVFTLYALDIVLNLTEGVNLDELQTSMQGHILAQASLTGLRSAP